MVGVAPQVGDSVPVGSGPRVILRQLCQTSGASFAWCSRPNAAAPLVADQGGAMALVVGASAVGTVAALLMVETVNMAQVPGPDGLAVKANILAVPGLVVLKEVKSDMVLASVVAVVAMVAMVGVAAAVARDSRSADCQCVASHSHYFQMEYVHSHVSFVGSKGYHSYVAAHPHKAYKLLR